MQAIALFLLFVQDAPAAKHPQTWALLQQFDEALRASTNERSNLHLLSRLNEKLKDEQLVAVEQYVATHDAHYLRWGLFRLLIERDRYDASARFIVQDLVPVESDNDKRYTLWKWWEYSF